jgi:anaerobic ribonucleoside-triphosphate reductase activating protein
MWVKPKKLRRAFFIYKQSNTVACFLASDGFFIEYFGLLGKRGENTMNYATIKWCDVSNGPGVRVSLYVSGCRNHCKNCFNPETWDFNYGEPFTKEVEDKIIEAMKPSYIRGFTLLGGDPFEPENQEALVDFLERLCRIYPEKSFWCFTGYDYERDLLTGKQGNHDTVMRMLNCFDVLVDGRFMEDKKDLTLRFKGSSNQRTILIKPSLETDEVVLWDNISEV